MAAVAGIFGFMMRSSEKGSSEKSKSGNQGSSAMAAVSSSWEACILTDIPLQYAFPFSDDLLRYAAYPCAHAGALKMGFMFQ